jgi:hypothetical protein
MHSKPHHPQARRRGVPQRAATADGHAAAGPGRGLCHCRWCFLRAQRPGPQSCEPPRCQGGARGRRRLVKTCTAQDQLLFPIESAKWEPNGTAATRLLLHSQSHLLTHTRENVGEGGVPSNSERTDSGCGDRKDRSIERPMKLQRYIAGTLVLDNRTAS